MFEGGTLDHSRRDVDVVSQVHVERDVEYEVFGFEAALGDYHKDIDVGIRRRVPPRSRSEQRERDEILAKTGPHGARELVERLAVRVSEMYGHLPLRCTTVSPMVFDPEIALLDNLEDSGLVSSRWSLSR